MVMTEAELRTRLGLEERITAELKYQVDYLILQCQVLKLLAEFRREVIKVPFCPSN
jgi:hypothetical protein